MGLWGLDEDYLELLGATGGLDEDQEVEGTVRELGGFMRAGLGLAGTI